MQDVVTRFMVHIVKELYLDLQEIDSQDKLSKITFGASANSIVYVELVGALSGIHRDIGLYYLSPDPRSKPPNGLLKIDAPDDMTQMVSAHAEQRTKICHLYLVNCLRGGSDREALIP